MQIIIQRFDQLDVNRLYDILRLRSEVFVLEQTCLYEDMDGKDQKALHVLLYTDERLVGYARLFKPGDYFKEAAIGRVLIRENYRNKGFAHQLMEAANQAVEEYFHTSTIRISAQTHLEEFYNQHDYRKIGEGYLEDGIPHINMIKH